MMHELGYTKDVVKTVCEVAKAHGAGNVKSVYLNIGEVRDIVDDLFRKCFAYMARDTVAEFATVVINRIPLTLFCRQCKKDFVTDVYSGIVSCPCCGTRNYEVRTGMEFSIDKIEVA